MSDIEERLKQHGPACDECHCWPLTQEAADEIGRLRHENAKLAMGLRAIIDDITGAELSKARAARAALEGK